MFCCLLAGSHRVVAGHGSRPGIGGIADQHQHSDAGGGSGNRTRSFEDAVQPTLAMLDAGGPTWYIDTSDGPADRDRPQLASGTGGDFPEAHRGRAQSGGSRDDRLQAVADRFYRGDIADALERWYIAQGGFLRKADLAAHKTRV